MADLTNAPPITSPGTTGSQADGAARTAFALGALVIGTLALLGWSFDAPALKSVLPGLVTMKANTALCLVASALGLLLVRARHGNRQTAVVPAAVPAVCGLLTLALGALTLVEYLTRSSLGIDELFFADADTPATSFPGRMAPATALAFVGVGAAVALLARATSQPGWRVAPAVAAGAHALAIVPAAIGYVSLAGYAYDVPALSELGMFVSVALNTAAALSFLAIALLLTVPDLGWRRQFRDAPVARKVVSRLVPAALILPLLTGAAVVWGARHRAYDPLLGPALFALAAALTITGAVFLSAEALRRSERRLRDTLAALLSSEDRLRVSQSTAHVGTWDWDIPANAVHWTPEQYRIFGLDPARHGPIDYETWRRSLHPADRDRTQAEVMAVVAGDTPSFETEYRIVLPASAGGGVRWLLGRGQVIRDARGAPLRMLGINMDITERKRAETALAENEEQLRLFVDRAPAAIAMFDQSMRYLAVSRRFLQDHGLDEGIDPAAMRGRSHYTVVPDLPERWRTIHQRVLAGETLSATDDPFPRAAGLTDWVRWEMTPWRRADGSIGGALLFSEFVTDRVEAERALAQSEARLRAIFEAAPTGIIIAEAPSGRLIYGNPAVGRIFRHPMRYSGDADQYDEWESYHADGSRVQGHDYPLSHTLRTGEPALGEYQFMCGDGVLRWVTIKSVPVLDEAGTMTAVVVISDDVDADRRGQAALTRSAAELEALVADRTQTLEAAQTRMAHLQRMEALGQLAGGIAHDFNNVLQAVQSGASLIERRPADPDAVSRLARMVFESARRGSTITRRLLAFSRRGDLRSEAISPVALLTSMGELLEHTLGTGIDVRVEAGSELPALLADRGQLETVLVNLGTNARDAMGSTGTLTLSASAETVLDGGPKHPAGLKPGSYVRLAISDNGMGMPPEVLARVTEPFFTTKQPGEGTGLGLAMARGFAEQSGGGLLVESTLGRGTTVTLWFTVSGQAASVASGPGAPADSQPGARLLVVDDDVMVRLTLTEELEAAGYAVLTAADGPAALALLDLGERVDLIVADLSMPGMDGVALVRDAQRRRPKLPAILLTGFANAAAEIAIGGALSGTFTLLRKPVEAALLAERIGMMLEGVTAGEC